MPKLMPIEIVRAMNAARIRLEMKRLEEEIETTKLHLSQLMNALPLAVIREEELAREARLMDPTSVQIRGVRVDCCASGRDHRGSFWVGAGPDQKLLAAYEYVRAGRYGNKRSGRVHGNPLGGMAGTDLEMALDRIYGKL